MSKKAKIILAVLAAVTVLAVGGAATVMAQDDPVEEDEVLTTSETGTQGLMARVAGILDISEDELVNAFKQARQDMRDEAIDRALDKAVEEGLIDETEAAEIRGWLAEKPEAIDRFLQKRARLCKPLCDRPMLRLAQRWQRIQAPCWSD
ncbi:MAG: hypothetical protein JSW16_06050 [Dehalococcoidales bacterium]|nr:MAG: hypothetical protein JSW16_06050 [Dehalococcoidales bacterium]